MIRFDFRAIIADQTRVIMSSETSQAKPKPKASGKRADAQRNLDRLLRTALEVFAKSGVDAPVREIAEKAGVGIGTLYRHFPQRSDLVAAVFRNEVDDCAKAGPELAAQHSAGEALVRWIERYVEFIVTKRGLATALNSGDPAFKSLPDYFLQQLRPVVQRLLDAAVASGEIRTGVEPDDLLYAVSGLCTPPGCTTPADAWRMVALFVDGLRYGAAVTSTETAQPTPTES